MSRKKTLEGSPGQALRKYRAGLELGTDELAASLDVNPSYISLLETSDRYPSLDLAYDIEELTEIPMGDWVKWKRKQERKRAHT